VNRAEKAEAKARQKERVAAILAGTDAAGAGAGVEEALNCWEEEAYEAETLETLAEFVRRDESHLAPS
jgi:2-oxoglutarate dehydrogenase complex dehydrogenase (E1) component-like enzyme